MNVSDVNSLTGSGAGWVASLGAALSWSLSVTLYRKFGVGHSPTWLNLFKGLIALACFGATALLTRNSEVVSAEVFWALGLSGFFGVFIGDSAFFASLLRIGSALTSTIQCLAPPLTAILAWIFLGEILRPGQILGLVITSCCLAALLYFEARANSRNAGSGLVSSKVFMGGVLFALLAALSQATGAVIARPFLNGLSPFVTAALRLWLPVLLLFFWEVRRHGGVLLTVKSIAFGRNNIFLAVGSFSGTFIGLTLMMYGMANAPLGVALALNSTYPIWIIMGERLLGRSSLGLRASIFVMGSVSGIWLMI